MTAAGLPSWRPTALYSMVPSSMRATSLRRTSEPSRFVRRRMLPNSCSSSSRPWVLDEQEFGNILLRTNLDGSEVRLKDVARIELGTMLYNAVGRHDGKPAAVIAVFQIPGTNAVEVANNIKATLQDLKKRFPRDMDYLISLDTT